MNNSIRNRKLAIHTMVALGLAPLSALAVIPADAPYNTDPQNAFVHDATSEGLNNLNIVLCIVKAMAPDQKVNAGPYIALIDKNKCDSSSQSDASNSSSGASGASAAANYITAHVDVTRASNSDPMEIKAWMDLSERGQSITVYAYGSATQSPDDAPPYGAFRMDYVGKNGAGDIQFNGFVQANGAEVTTFETSSDGSGAHESALAMNASSATAASGYMSVPDWSTNPPGTTTFKFAYDGSEASFAKGVFMRSENAGAAVCFDRSLDSAEKSVWRYGTYDADTGNRVDQANPGFPLNLSDGSSSYFGYASYWGINFQGFDLNNRADGKITGVTITDQRPSNSTTTYDLYKVSGKLTKWTQHTTQLSALDGIPFVYFGNIQNTDVSPSNQTINSVGGIWGPGQWEMHWDNTQSRFIVTGKQVCDSGPCMVVSFDSAATATVNNGVFSTKGINGWSQAFGGNIDIPSTNADHVGTDTLAYFTQEVVIPGSTGAPTALYCLNNCPDQTSIGAFTGNNSPFNTNTVTQFGSGNTQITYAFGATGLTESSSAMTVTDSSKLTGQYQWGVMTGRLYDSTLAGACGGPTYCEPNGAATYYTWQTGANSWQQSLWLTAAGNASSVVAFDPPQNASYTLPNDGAVYGSWANKTVQLQFNGFGNLQGIPGACVDPDSNAEVQCGPNVRYVPAFAIPDGATMTLQTGSGPTSLIVKGLDAEIRLGKIAGCTGVTLTLPTGTATLPTSADLHNPSSSSDSTYLGTQPTVDAPPAVIHGVVQ